MLQDDYNLSVTALQAAMHNEKVPMSELIRKEFYYKSYMSFKTAVGADPALIADEVRKQCKRYDWLFGTIFQKTKAERVADNKFTQGDFQRFCCVYFLITRKLLHACEMIMLRENKKRVMVRHIMAAAVLTGIIPKD